MKRLLYSSLSALVVVLLLQGPATAQETRSAEGTITAVGPASITVKVNDKEMTFNVDAKTEITTPGGSTKTRAAEAEGKPGLKLADYLKVGQGVEVRYHEQGMHAASIRTLPSPPKTGSVSGPPPQTANGVVSAVTSNSVTIKASGGEMTFMLDEKTSVIGTGAGTTSREKKEAGQKPVITDFVAAGDTVAITYRESGGKMLASEVRVRSKGRS
jgi:hypothetical protein